jgi:ectoine hydroxylase-related dioxygenase (phytanoyl-CoA dioxygenase family)
MTASELEEAKTHLREHGWATLNSVLGQDEIKTTLNRLWQAQADADARGEDGFVPFLDPNPSNVRVFFLMEVDKIFRDLVSHPTAIELVKAALGENFIISNFTANIARPGSQSMALHSDQSLVCPDPWEDVWALNVIWCLTDVYKENGATMYIPGSNKWTSRKDVPANAPSLLKPFEANAGDIIIMDGRVWHTSGSNTTEDCDRAQLFGYYTKPFMRQQIKWTAKLPKEIQESLSDEMREWLGLNVIANVDMVGDWRYMSVQYPDHADKAKEGENGTKAVAA